MRRDLASAETERRAVNSAARSCGLLSHVARRPALRPRARDFPATAMEIDESVQRRDAVASALLESLKTGCGGSDVALRGSLASGAADAYSDIDLTWVVPDGAFLDSVER